MALLYSRYRFKYVRMKFLASPTAGAGVTAIGVVDDSVGEGDTPTTVLAVAELRCSGTSFGSQSVPTELEWTPSDRSQWMFTFAGATGSDGRLTTSGQLVFGSTVASTLNVEIDFCIVFKGAVDQGST